MASPKKVIVFGLGSHIKIIKEICELNNIKILGFITDKKIRNKKKNGLKNLGNFKIFSKNNDKKKFHIIVGIGENILRKKYFLLLKKKNFKFTKLIHPNSQISKTARIKAGTLVNTGATINANANIGYNCIINTNSLLEHDVKIKDHCHICPGAKIGGGTQVQQNSLIGLGAIVIDKIKIGKNVVVGAGSTIFKNLKDNSTYIGKSKKIK